MVQFKTLQQENKHADELCRERYMHRKTCTCSQKYPLHLVKFADSGYYAFFCSQLFLKL